MSENGDLLKYLDGRIVSLFGEVEALKTKGQEIFLELKTTEKSMLDEKDEEAYVKNAVKMQTLVIDQTEFQNQLIKTIDKLKELTLLQELYDKREDNKNIYEDMKSYQDSNVFVISGNKVKEMEPSYLKAREGVLEKSKANLVKEAREYFKENNK